LYVKKDEVISASGTSLFINEVMQDVNLEMCSEVQQCGLIENHIKRMMFL
jgi:hypothetical protein